MITSTNSVPKRMSPECEVVALAAKGVPFPKHAGAVQELSEGLSSRVFKLYFPYYWDHEEVQLLRDQAVTAIDPKHFLWYLQNLARVVLPRFPDRLHWTETCNLFHFFGFMRLLDSCQREELRNLLDNEFGYRDVSSLRSTVDISALSVRSALEQRSSEDMQFLCELLSARPEFLEFYGHYQIQYYGGLTPCIDRIAGYVGGGSELFVPQTVLGLLAVQRNEPTGVAKANTSEIHDRLVAPLSLRARNLLNPFLTRERSN